MLSSSLDLDETLSNVAHLLLPRLADWCTIDLHPDQDTYRRLVVAHNGSDRNPLLRRLLNEAPNQVDGSEWEKRVLSGETVQVDLPHESGVIHRQGSSEYQKAVKELGARSVISVPMKTRHGVVGILTAVMAESERLFNPTEVEAISLIGQRCGMAIENASFFGQAQEALRERMDSLDLMQAIFGGSSVGLAFLDPHQRLKFANEELGRIVGIDVTAAAGTQLQDCAPQLADGLGVMVKEIVEGHRSSQQVELELPNPDRPSARTICMATCHPARDKAGDLVGIGLVLTDISERRQAEFARQHSEDQLRLALAAASMGSWQWDADSDITTWSDTAAILLGQGDVRSATGKGPFGPECNGSHDATDNASTKDGAYETEFEVEWTDGSRHVLLSKAQTTQVNGTITGLTGILLDITEERARRDAGARLVERQTRAGEQAVRMQRVTAKLSNASSIDEICEVLLAEGSSITQAARSMVYLISERGDALERSHSVGFPPSTPEAWNRIDLKDPLPVPEAVRSQQPVLANNADSLIEQFPAVEVAREAGLFDGFAVFPLTVNGRAIGAWSMLWDEPRTFEEGELIIFLTLASQCAQSVDRARLLERERFIATALQRTLLPAQLPTLTGATTAWRYIPSASGVEVGGDWYDVLPLPRQRVALVIGDVGGHNIDAAAVMGQIRNAIRSYAWEGHPAAKVMEATNRLLCGLEPGVMVTCCYVELSLEDGIAAVCLAGHPPPLVVEADGDGSFMDAPADPPLGAAPDHTYEQTSLFLTPKQSLVLYTDGLVETREVSLTDGMSYLAESVRDATDTSAEGLANAVMKGASKIDVEDDMALLVLQYAPSRPLVSSNQSRSVRRSLPSSAASAGVARRFASDVMTDWGAEELSDTVALCVSELVTNALIHTATDIELILFLDAESVRVDVIDHSDRMPSMRAGGDEATTGRGLHIVEAISSAWGVEPVGSGKAVWFSLDRMPAGVSV